MSILSTLRLTKRAKSKVGQIQIQPIKDSMRNLKDAAKKNNSASTSHHMLPVIEQKVPGLNAIVLRDNNIDNNAAQSMANIIKSMKADPATVIPVLPTSALNRLSLTPSKKIDRGSSSTDELILTTRRFEPYEQLLGISQERPELIMMMQFLPLFDESVQSSFLDIADRAEDAGYYSFMTDAGMFFDAQLVTKILRKTNSLFSVRTLRDKNSAFHDDVNKNKSKFQQTVTTLDQVATFLQNVLRKSDMLKQQFDLRNGIFDVKVQKFIRDYVAKFSQFASSDVSAPTLNFARDHLPLSINFVDALSSFGFVDKNVRENFSSTKIWMQLMLEYKHMLLDYSLEFVDLDVTTQRIDNNAISITDHASTKYFDFKGTLPRDALSIVEIMSTTNKSQLRSLLTMTKNMFSSMYERGTSFKSPEARIATLINLFAREYKYSAGLQKTEVLRPLAEYYRYGVSSVGNEALFDNVIGVFGNNITEFPAIETNSLTNLAQHQPATNVAVTTFESKYLETDSSVLTPGAAYYVDDVYRIRDKEFNVTHLKEFSNTFHKAYDNFAVFVRGMKIGDVVDVDPRKPIKTAAALTSASTLMKMILDVFVDRNTGKTKKDVVNDRLAAVYATASVDSTLRAALFLYTINKIGRAYNNNIPVYQAQLTDDNTSMIEALISRIITAINSATKSSAPRLPASANKRSGTIEHVDMPSLSVKVALNKGTYVTNAVEELMSRFLSAFQEAGAFVSNYSRFGGYLDTIVMMSIFDAIISVINRYGNQVLAGSRNIIQKNHRETVYVINKTDAIYLTQINDLQSRLDSELAKIQQTTYVILNALKRLADSADEFVNFLQQPDSKAILQNIDTVINDQNMLQYVFDRQQIMLFTAAARDLLRKLNSVKTMRTTYKKYVGPDVDGDGDFDADDEIKILDNWPVASQLRNIIYAVLSDKEFATSKAFNKKILTVGIPLGFVRTFKQKTSVEYAQEQLTNAKQNDIVTLNVYKVDLLNQDIVYKPLKFLFEMSRFPVRDDMFYRDIEHTANMSDAIAAIPMRDLAEAIEENTNDQIGYWDPAQRASLEKKLAFSTKSYDFLTLQDKNNLARNHVLSYLLEVYINVMTGMSTSDIRFSLKDSPPLTSKELVTLLVDHQVQEVVNFVPPIDAGKFRQKISSSKFKTVLAKAKKPSVTAGKIFVQTVAAKLRTSEANTNQHIFLQRPTLTTASGIAGKAASLLQQTKATKVPTRPTLPRAAQRNLPSLSRTISQSIDSSKSAAMIQSLKSINEFIHTLSTLSDSLAVQHRLLVPKQFDRVFNVIIDPDDFEIDFDQTLAGENGIQTLQALIERGDIEATPTSPDAKRQFEISMLCDDAFKTYSTYKNSSEILNNFKFRDRDRSQGDASFEKYFVTIESLDEDENRRM